MPFSASATPSSHEADAAGGRPAKAQLAALGPVDEFDAATLDSPEFDETKSGGTAFADTEVTDDGFGDAGFGDAEFTDDGFDDTGFDDDGFDDTGFGDADVRASDNRASHIHAGHIHAGGTRGADAGHSGADGVARSRWAPTAAGFFDVGGSDADIDLADRTALRRIPGLATELTDVTEVEYRQLRLEQVVLIGVWTSGTLADARTSMTELAALATTAGSVVLDALVQRRDTPDTATFVGSGKAKELRDVVAATGADTVVCDGELTPGQLRKLEEVVKVKVIDRTALILDIFAQHATSREGKAQVELAQLQYMLPRLRGWGESMSRSGGGMGTGGGIGTRGPGETKIETDRRRLRARMARLRREIVEMKKIRATKRSARKAGPIPAVTIAGYTNAGKSSLLNRLTGAGVLVDDALFATLDPTVRRATLPDGRVFTLADTVGFVRHLPHQIVEAFRSTLEEVGDADLLLHVVDGSHPDPISQISAVRTVVNDIDAGDVSELIVVNKIDTADPDVLATLRREFAGAVFVSARTGEGMSDLIDALSARIPHPEVEVHALVPYTRGDLVSRAHADGEVLTTAHTAAGTELRARVPMALAAEFAGYSLEPA